MMLMVSELCLWVAKQNHYLPCHWIPNVGNVQSAYWFVVYFRYDPDLARFEDPPCVAKPNDETAFKSCPSCVRIRQKQLVWFSYDF